MKIYVEQIGESRCDHAMICYHVIWHHVIWRHDVVVSTVASKQECPGFNFHVGRDFLCGVCSLLPRRGAVDGVFDPPKRGRTDTTNLTVHDLRVTSKFYSILFNLFLILPVTV